MSKFLRLRFPTGGVKANDLHELDQDSVHDSMRVGLVIPSMGKFTALLMAAFVAISVSPAAAESLPSTNLEVQIDEVTDTRGCLMIALFNETMKSEFPGPEFPFRSHRICELSETLTFTFPELEPGTYAISAFQDTDLNGELDTTFYGVPIEPIGISNNAVGVFGPPSFADAEFSVEAERLNKVAFSMITLSVVGLPGF